MSAEEPKQDPVAQQPEDKKEETFFDDNGEPITKSAYKKLQKMKAAEAKRAEQAKKHAEHLQAQQALKAQKEAEDDAVVVQEKPADLAKYTPMDILDVAKNVDGDVVVKGWASVVRRQAKMIFVEMRDGHGVFLQAVLDGVPARTAEAKALTKESSVIMYGKLHKVEGRSHQYELAVAYWELVSAAHNDYASRYNPKESAMDVLLSQRHLVLREKKETLTLQFGSEMAHYFREYFRKSRFTEVFPPTIVQNQVEGGSTLFELEYFGEKAYLTQSSQLYLEAAAPALRNVYCLVPSYRAEKSFTRRHLTTFMHLEAEMSFIDFDQLRSFIEDLIMYVVDNLLGDEHFGKLVKEMNPNFIKPERPFMRMDYKDAITWLNERDIKKDDETPFVFGDDIPESQERKMVDAIGKPIFLSRFPVEMKPFYMPKDGEDKRVTESCDLLMPGVGEIVGGSMRIWDEAALLAGFEREKLDVESYSWYTDMRRYGSVPHGGFGLGYERFICWFLGLFNIREACLFPRSADRCKP